ncbi:MAG: type II toxin-antitoxin system VapC family toxin [Pseudomonadota bacterium]|nr:type II toxin-antitoxin system VapC family toxin [Pseudomonadota bacterium]
MNKSVLDASALLALLNQEAGADQVAAVIPRAALSAVNLAEVVAKLIDGGMPTAAVREALDTLGLHIVDFTETLAYESAALRAKTKKLGLSVGDRACLATIIYMELPVLTADRDRLKLKTSIKITCIR